MKHFKFPAALALVALLVLPLGTYAHTLKVDGNVGAVLHLDPNDAPIAGQSTPAYLEFKNNKQAFSLPAYTVTITVSGVSDHVEHVVPAESMRQTSADTLAFSYTFPKEDVYELVVAGTPNDPSSPPFSLTYDVRVDMAAAKGAGTWTPFLQEHTLHIIIIGGGILIGAFITIRDERRRRKAEREATNVKA